MPRHHQNTLTAREESKIRTLIGAADRKSIETEFTKIPRNWKKKKWLQDRNVYRRDCLENINDDFGSGNNPSSDRHRYLREYIAASTVTHCADGWSFLGRAIEANLKGDHNSSRHLGYYAELRAAMALLATEGIGVFNSRHIAVDVDKKCTSKRTLGTHKFVWFALKYWAEQSKASKLILSVIKPGDIPISDWLSQFVAGNYYQSIIAEEWLKQWGLDLQYLHHDHDARNMSSYRPTAFTSPRAIEITKALRFVTEFWEICQPVESARFPVLDRYLLRACLEKCFKSSEGVSRKRAPKKYEANIKTMLKMIAPKDLSESDWIRFLTNKESPSIFDKANEEPDATKPQHHLQVLARATLLLRLATGSCASLFQEIDESDRLELKFWLSSLGEDRCLWHKSSKPNNSTDLWIDIEEAIDDLQQWQRDSPSADISYKNLWQDQATAAGILGTSERVTLWGFGL